MKSEAMEQVLKSWWTRKILLYQGNSPAPTPLPLGVHQSYTVFAPTPFYRQILAFRLNQHQKA